MELWGRERGMRGSGRFIWGFEKWELCLKDD